MACWPGLFHHKVADFLDTAAQAAGETLFGSLSIDQVQLVPQSFGLLDEAVVDMLRAEALTDFRADGYRFAERVFEPDLLVFRRRQG